MCHYPILIYLGNQGGAPQLHSGQGPLVLICLFFYSEFFLTPVCLIPHLVCRKKPQLRPIPPDYTASRSIISLKLHNKVEVHGVNIYPIFKINQ